MSKNTCKLTDQTKMVVLLQILYFIFPVRNLYSPTALGIDGFLQTRKRAKEQFTSYADKFRNKMNEFVDSKEQMIFTEDLKNMIHLAEPTDLKLILGMIQR